MQVMSILFRSLLSEILLSILVFVAVAFLCNEIKEFVARKCRIGLIYLSCADGLIGAISFCYSLPSKFGQFDVSLITAFSVMMGEPFATMDSEENEANSPEFKIFFHSLVVVTKLIFLHLFIRVFFLSISTAMKNHQNLKEDARARARNLQIASWIQERCNISLHQDHICC